MTEGEQMNPIEASWTGRLESVGRFESERRPRFPLQIDSTQTSQREKENKKTREGAWRKSDAVMREGKGLVEGSSSRLHSAIRTVLTKHGLPFGFKRLFIKS